MSGPKRLTVRYLAFGLIAAGLGWALVAHGLVAVLARIAPSYALLIRSDNPAALLASIERTLDASRRPAASNVTAARFGFRRPQDQAASGPQSTESETSAETDEVARRQEVRRGALVVLAQQPGNARVLAILGELKRAEGEEEQAAILLRASAHRSLREPQPHGWLIHEALNQKDWSLAMRHADVLMRMHEDAIKPLTPLIAHLAETVESAAAVKHAITATPSPPWRTAVLIELLNAIGDVRTPLELLVSLKGTAAPPTSRELSAYLTFLIQRKFFDLAYYSWLQFLSPEELASVGLLFNGSFERRPSGLPFDWVLPTGGTASVSLVRRWDRPSTRALVVHLGHGRAELGATTQLLRLRPGRYRVDGELMGEVVGRRGLRWRVMCLGGPLRQAGESDMFVGEIKEWTAFSFSVLVPDADCAAQQLSLILDARTPSERMASGTVWFDELAIRNEPATASPGQESQSQPRHR